MFPSFGVSGIGLGLVIFCKMVPLRSFLWVNVDASRLITLEFRAISIEKDQFRCKSNPVNHFKSSKIKSFNN